MNVQYRYWNKIRNCGDAITAYLLRDVLNLSPVAVGRDTPHLLATGSIFFMARANSHIWGSGILDPANQRNLRYLPEVPSANIHAVRGRRTLAALQHLRDDVGDLPLGDPGILVRYLLDRPGFAALPIRYRAAIVPHYQFFDSRDRRRDPADCCTIDMRDATLRPLELIQQSEVVISQSLHGLIFAAALGKPYVWISHSADEEWVFKFEDWFSTSENPQIAPFPLDTAIDTLIAAAERRPPAIDVAALLAAFPRAAVCTPGQTPMLDFETCRAMGVAVVRADWTDGIETIAALGDADARRKRLFARGVHAQVKSYCAGWSEIPYLLILPPDAPTPALDWQALATFMDRYKSIDGATVLTGPAGSLDRDPKLSTRDMSVSRSPTFAPGIGLLLRPGVGFSFDNMLYTIAAAGS